MTTNTNTPAKAGTIVRTAKQTTETDHLIRFLDAVFGTPLDDAKFTRTCLQYKMHETSSRRAFVCSLYEEAIRCGQ